VDGMSNKFCHGQVGQLAENKLSYFIHLHKLHSEQWAELVESTKYNSRSKLLQTNGHHAQIASTHKAVLQAYMLYFLMPYTACLFLILTASDRVKTKTETEMCKTEMKRKRKNPLKRKQNWNLNYTVKTKWKLKRK